MIIYIPSLGRPTKQATLYSLPVEINYRVRLVVSAAEFGEYAARWQDKGVKILQCPAHGIGRVRQWIIEQHDVAAHGSHIVMMDDDLRFFVRAADPTKFLAARAVSIIRMLDDIDCELCDYPLVGVTAREGGNRIVKDIVDTRLLRLLAYNVEVMRKENIRFDRLPVMEDFDAALQLLEKGYHNLLLHTYCHDQGTSNAPGGCSTYRNPSVQREGALGLRELHPLSVKVVEKITKTAWNGLPRTDVMVQWKRAYHAR